MIKQIVTETNSVVAVVAQPVLHTHTKPDMVVNHPQRTLPEIQSLRQCTHTSYTCMMLKNNSRDRFIEDQENGTQRNHKNQSTQKYYFAVTKLKGDDEECCNEDSYPRTKRLTQIEHQEQGHADCDCAYTHPP